MLGAYIFNGIIYVQKDTWSKLIEDTGFKVLNSNTKVKIITFPMSIDYNTEKCISIPVGHVAFRPIDETLNSKLPTCIRYEYCTKVEYEKVHKSENYHWLTLYLEY